MPGTNRLNRGCRPPSGPRASSTTRTTTAPPTMHIRLPSVGAVLPLQPRGAPRDPTDEAIDVGAVGAQTLHGKRSGIREARAARVAGGQIPEIQMGHRPPGSERLRSATSRQKSGYRKPGGKSGRTRLPRRRGRGCPARLLCGHPHHRVVAPPDEPPNRQMSAPRVVGERGVCPAEQHHRHGDR